MKSDPLIDRLSDSAEATARRLLKLACDEQLTIATAESCTGGLLSALLTDVEGVAHAFEREFVVYTEQAKTELLGVHPQLIRDHGAVSRPVAIAMALGALERSGADLALAITGFAGPGGEDEEPGLVHLACVRRGHSPRHECRQFGNVGRTAVRAKAVETAMAMLLQELE